MNDTNPREQQPLNFKSVKFVVAAFVSTLTLAALLFIASPFFHIEHVIIQGETNIPQREIRERLDVRLDTNLLFFNTRNARRRLMENHYIGNVEFTRRLPNSLTVTLTERRLTAYVEHSPGSYLFLDDMGRVLEVRTSFVQPLPILEGLQFTRFQLGELLEVPDTVAFSAVVLYAQLLYQHGLISRVTSMNVTDAENIHILVDNRFVFNVGNAHRADEKIRTIIEILNSMPIPELMSGFADISNLRGDTVFEMLQ